MDFAEKSRAEEVDMGVVLFPHFFHQGSCLPVHTDDLGGLSGATPDSRIQHADLAGDRAYRLKDLAHGR
ncbi:hypothetical protein EBT23_02720 [bacterium]|nr:hypothetical protein [bacterium]